MKWVSEIKNSISKIKPVIYAILAAALFGISAPFSKLLLGSMPPVFLAGLLYFGAGLGMLVVDSAGRKNRITSREARLDKGDLFWVVAMIALDVLAPVLLLFGLSRTTSANASLLFNFEIVATTLVAMLFFKESINKRITFAITLITTASIVLSFEPGSALKFSTGSILVIGACLCWGFENNCTRNISAKSPSQIVILKGIFSGGTSLVIALLSEKITFNITEVLFAMLLGFFSYGLSVFFYIKAQRDLGAARTSAYYAVAPFAGVIFSFFMFGLSGSLSVRFIAAFAIMCAGAYLSVTERHSHSHTHAAMQHEHRHTHDDNHHAHRHDGSEETDSEHSHMHAHEPETHTHKHTPDIHHRHSH